MLARPTAGPMPNTIEASELGDDSADSARLRELGYEPEHAPTHGARPRDPRTDLYGAAGADRRIRDHPQHVGRGGSRECGRRGRDVVQRHQL